MNALHSRRLALATRLAPAAVALVLLAGCAVNPATGRREFSLVSADQELAIGREGYPATIDQYGLYDDPALASYVDSVGHRVARASDLPALEWHFTVLDDPMVNAFAMPGGYIYVTRGLLAHLRSEAQLAGVLGHEIGHVCARHTAKQITQQQLAGIGLAVAGAVSNTFRSYGGAAQQALGLLMLKYSRDDESQADALGIRYAAAAGYDPREVPPTFATLKRISVRAGSTLPFYLSTHPDPGDREGRTTALAAEYFHAPPPPEIRGHAYLEHVRGLVFGVDPRGGWFDGAHFVHPNRGFQLDLPPGWNVQNSHAAVSAAEPQQHAMMQVGVAASAGALAPADYVAALRRDGRIADAAGRGETLGGWPAWVGRISVPAGDGTSRVLIAAWARTGPDQLLECLAQSTVVGDADEQRILAAMRTLRPIADAHVPAREPDRVRVVVAPRADAFKAQLERLGPSAQGAEDAAILNGLELETPVAASEWLKIVEPGRR